MATARTRTSAPGSERAAARRGFTLVELLVVVALVALVSGLVSLAVRDPATAQLDQEAARLSALLEAARAESRASGVVVRFELASDGGAGFRFTGLPPGFELPAGWLDPNTRAQILGAPALQLGPEPLIGAQRIVLRLGERLLALSTDGLAPFAPEVIGGAQ